MKCFAPKNNSRLASPKKMFTDWLLLVLPIKGVCDIIDAYAAAFSCKKRAQVHFARATIRTIAAVDNTRLAVSTGKTVWIFDLLQDRVLRTFQQRGVVTRMAGLNSNLLACAGNHKIKVWDVDSGQCWSTMSWHDRILDVRHMVGSTGGLVVNRDDGDLQVWDVLQKKLLHALARHAREVITVADKSQIATILDNNAIQVFDAVTGNLLHTLGALQVRLGLCELPNGMLAFTEREKSHISHLWLWQPGTVDIAKTHVDLPQISMIIQLIPAGDCMIVTRDYGGGNHLIDLQSGLCTRIKSPFYGVHKVSRAPYALCNDCAQIGEMVAVVDSAQTVHFYQ